MKALKLLLLAFVLGGFAGCASTESAGGDEDEKDERNSAADGSGYRSGSTFVRPGDPISRHQQTLGGQF